MEHTLRFILDEDENLVELYLDIYLGHSYYGFWGRLWAGIKYVLGFRSKYGHFGSWILQQEDADRLSILLDKYKNSTRPKM
jgi:hypothetical protein